LKGKDGLGPMFVGFWGDRCLWPQSTPKKTLDPSNKMRYVSFYTGENMQSAPVL